MWFFAVLLVLAMGGIAMVAAGRGAPMAPAYDDRPDAMVPRDGALGAAHLRQVRFSLAFRGYRMSEVDALLDRLAQQLEAADRADESHGDTFGEPADESADDGAGDLAVDAPGDDDGPGTPATPAR